MEQNIYQMSLIITGIINLVMGTYLLFGGHSYIGGARFLYMLPRIFVR